MKKGHDAPFYSRGENSLVRLWERDRLAGACPGKHATAQIVHVVETLLLQEGAGLRRTGTAAAYENRLGLFIQLVQANGDRGQWHGYSPRNGTGVDLIHFADINDPDRRIFSGDQLDQISGFYLFDIKVHIGFLMLEQRNISIF
jgi:hypothetical protein